MQVRYEYVEELKQLVLQRLQQKVNNKKEYA